MMLLHAVLLATLPSPLAAAELPNVCLPSAPRPGPRASFVVGGGSTLSIECPPDTKFECDGSTDPSSTGFPTITGSCDPNPVVTFVDQILPVSTCPTNRFDQDIVRTWTVTDSCGGFATCTQAIHVIKQLGYLDIKPQSCPNPFNLGSGGVVQMSILGTADFDVHTIVPGSVRIWTLDCAGGPVTPSATGFEDTGTPFTGAASCGCHALGGDGRTDLRLKFDKAAMQSGLGLAGYPHMSFVKIFVTAELTNGCGFIASDCIRIQ